MFNILTFDSSVSCFVTTIMHTASNTEHVFHLQQHVQDGRKENLAGFMKTFEKAMPPDENPGIFALDCEMVENMDLLLY